MNEVEEVARMTHREVVEVMPQERVKALAPQFVCNFVEVVRIILPKC